MSRFQVDMVTFDPNNDEYVLYLIEDGPWPTNDLEWKNLLIKIQAQIFNCFDVAVDGELTKQFPESIGRDIRIEIDSPHGVPVPLKNLVSKINEFINSNHDYAESILNSKFVKSVRVVTGEEMGRFHSQ
jgi:hypothetical protein